jgi:hypothetical protein
VTPTGSSRQRRSKQSFDSPGGWSVRALIVGGAVALLAACGSTLPGSGSSSSSAGAAAGGGGGTATAPAACTLITQSEAAAVVGVSVTKQDSGVQCLWSGATGESLGVGAYAPGIDPKTTVQSGHACNFGANSPISVGDVAVYCGSSAQGSGIAFAKKGILVQMQCAPGGSASACDKNAFVSAAQTAAGRI